MTELRNSELYDAKGLAGLLKVSKRTVFRFLSSGKIPAPLRIGGAVRWRESDIDLFIRCDGDMDKFNVQKMEGGGV